MAKINFNMNMNTERPSTTSFANTNKKKLLDAGSYNSKILRVQFQPKGKGRALTITFGAYDISKGGFHAFIDHDIFLSHASENFLVKNRAMLFSFVNALGISPDIFDDEYGVSNTDIGFLLNKKMVIQVEPKDESFKEPGTGREIQYRKNRVVGFSQVGVVANHVTMPKPGSAYNKREQEVPDEIPAYAQFDDSLNDVIPF